MNVHGTTGSYQAHDQWNYEISDAFRKSTTWQKSVGALLDGYRFLESRGGIKSVGVKSIRVPYNLGFRNLENQSRDF